MKKRYKIEYDWQATMIVEVDDEVLTPANLKDWNEFWSGAEDRVHEGNGSPLGPLLIMMYLSVIRDGDQLGALRNLREGREEGFLKMDGSEGITIVNFDEFEFDERQVECNEVSA
jgi:hypothetical protein